MPPTPAGQSSAEAVFTTASDSLPTSTYRTRKWAMPSATVAAALDHGIRFFDTAPHYGAGVSELRLGRALQGVDRAGVAIATKVGRRIIDGQKRNDLPDHRRKEDRYRRAKRPQPRSAIGERCRHRAKPEGKQGGIVAGQPGVNPSPGHRQVLPNKRPR